MRGFRTGRAGAYRLTKAGIAILALAAGLPAAAQAQYYDGPRGYYEEERVYRAPPRRVVRDATGFNCAAVQQGMTGPKPYSCPLPGPRPLGARCFCDLPVASFSPAQTAVGHVVP